MFDGGTGYCRRAATRGQPGIDQKISIPNRGRILSLK
ncbi:hypothetical protein MJN54_35095 [Salmonella enterica subsp. enterica serovar Kentucky]|nr:hypothetical protein [Salmonella enterica subsp. enterica serovar Kentucky]